MMVSAFGPLNMMFLAASAPRPFMPTMRMRMAIHLAIDSKPKVAIMRDFLSMNLASFSSCWKGKEAGGTKVRQEGEILER